MKFALPHIMGWDQALTNHHPAPPAISKPRVERPHPDSEWERWSFLVAARWWRLLGISRRCCCNVWSIGVLEQCLRTLSAVCIRFLELKRLRPDEARWTIVFVECMYNSTTPTKCIFLVELAVLPVLVICERCLCLVRVRINWAWCSESSLFGRPYRIVDYLLLAGLVWEKNTVSGWKFTIVYEQANRRS